GGLAPLIDALPPTSLWRRFLGVFSEAMSLDEPTFERVKAAMREPENASLFLLLWVFQACGAQQSLPVRDAHAMLAAILLERVFEGAVVDADIGKAYVDPGRDEARSLAQKVMPAMADQFGAPYLVFRGKALIEARREWERTLGVAVGSQTPTALLALEEETQLDWLVVQKHMSVPARECAARYFQRARHLRGVFTRDARSRNRSSSWGRDTGRR
ncbi:MAG TPA: hypothetical protein VD906_12390, partial [Caulobacteraceae bacterium]|nr:hypothetical protein [Caulobacteraceae bacterium]